MSKAFGVLASWLICFSFLTIGHSALNASVPLDNLPLPMQINPDMYSPENFTTPSVLPAADSLAKNAHIPQMSWSDFYGQPNLLQPRSLELMPLNKSVPPWWMLAAIILSLAGFAYARLNFPYKTKLYFLALASGRHFNQLEREGGFFKETPTWILFGIFVLALSMLIYETVVLYPFLEIMTDFHDHIRFIAIVAGVLAFFVFKGIVNAYLAWVFQTHTAKTAFGTNAFLFNNLIGISLIPVVAINLYNPSEALLLSGWFIFLIFNVLKLINGIVVGKGRNKFSAYYFIMYLCTVEILPLLLIVRLTGIYVLLSFR